MDQRKVFRFSVVMADHAWTTGVSHSKSSTSAFTAGAGLDGEIPLERVPNSVYLSCTICISRFARISHLLVVSANVQYSGEDLAGSHM